MREFERAERPEKKHRDLSDDYFQNFDEDVEEALMSTLDSGDAVKIPLVVFHSSPAKGRIHRAGFKLRHRVREDQVYAWVSR